jgi:5-methylcytosine-specific restriction endonuclease McrA
MPSGPVLDSLRACKTTEWRKNNPEKAKALQDSYAERQKIANAEYYQRNKEKICARQANYYKQNLDKNKATQKIYRSKNSTSLRNYIAVWRKENSDLCRIYHQNRRGRLANGVGCVSVGRYENLILLQKGKCACCHVNLKKTKVHLDHIMPLALGGAHADKNLQLLCAKCNLQKRAKHPVDFMQSKGFLL